MPRTETQTLKAVEDVEAWLNSLSPADFVQDDITDLRAVAQASLNAEKSRQALNDAVSAARANGRSWGRIAMALGVSRQAARERFS